MGIKCIAGQKHFSAERKNGGFSAIPARTGPVVILGHFFDGQDSSIKFRRKRSKIKGTYTYELTQAQKGQKQGGALKNDPLSENGNFFRLVWMGKL